MSNGVFDVFGGSPFAYTALTDAINKMPYVPGKVGAMGIFEEMGVPTTSIEVEEYQGSLSLIPTTPRGGPGIQNKHNKRVMRNFKIPHLQLEDAILADEVQNVRVFGSTDLTQGAQAVLDIRAREMNGKHDATLEYSRMGALKGIIYDADGSTVIYNLFTEFGVTQQVQDFTFGTAANTILRSSMGVKGMIEDELGAGVYEQVIALVDPIFFANLISRADILAAYQFQQGNGSNILRTDLRYDGVLFGGILYIQYRGNVGGVPFLPANSGIAFPIGAVDLYKTYFAPADWMETANTLGLPRYAKQYPNWNGKSIIYETQSNPLSLCKRPRVLIRLYSSN